MSPGSDRRNLAAWIALGTAVLVLRLPLLLLPGLGRDEATYVYWSHHPEWAYAPLLQLALRLSHALGGSAPWSYRLGTFLVALAVLALFERWLAARGHGNAERALAVSLLALTPWQTLAGSLVHPDGWQLAGVLAWALSVRHRRWKSSAVSAAAALWAKPSGLLAVGAAIFALLRPGADRRARAHAAGLLLLLALPPLLALRPGLVEALRSFGSVGEEVGIGGRLALLLLGTVFLAGPLLPWVGLRGLRDAPRGPERILGLGFLAAFGAAAVWTGQVKGNWMLPAVLLLWPAPGRWHPGRRLLVATTTVSVILSAATVAGLRRPLAVRALEARLGSHVPAYLGVAGQREARVAPATQWWQRCAEYRDIRGFCEDIADRLGETPVAVVVSDDYGLAAQWAVRCPKSVPCLVLPLDPLFAPAPLVSAGGATLVLSERTPFAELLPGQGVQYLGAVPHPITGHAVRLGRLTEDIVP